MNINKTCISIILLTLITFGVYCNSLNAPFIYDDIAKIVKNPDIKKLGNIKNKLIYPYAGQKSFMRNDSSRPLTYLTFTLNYYFGKLNPSGYRLFNLLFHILNALLVFLLIKKIIPGSIIIPFFVSLFFAIHPVNTDAVTYIFGRSNVLVTFFYILSILFFKKYSVIARPGILTLIL